MKSIKILAAFFTAFIVTSAAAAEITPIVSENFDSLQTNTESATLSISGAPFSRVVENGRANKGYMIDGADSEAIVGMKYTTAEQKYTISMDIKSDYALNGSFNLLNGTTPVSLITFENGVPVTSDGKKLQGIKTYGDDYVRFTVALNKKRGIYSIFADGRYLVENWNLPSNAAFAGIQLNFSLGNGEKVYLDNLYVYPGVDKAACIGKCFINSVYNTQGVEFVPIEDDLGDYTFFDSNWVIINNNPVCYLNGSLVPKTNSITAEKFDVKNPEKGDRIILTKTTNDDCYVDITTTLSGAYQSTKKYKYFALEAEVMCDFNGGVAGYIMIRDTKTTSSQQNYNIVQFSNTGNITTLGGGAVSGVCRDGNWFKVNSYINLQTHKADVFIDGKQIVNQASLPTSFSSLDLVRFMYSSGTGTGEMQLRNVKLRGMDKPFEGEEIKTSMFSDNEQLKSYLENKTVFHAYGEVIYSGGQKSGMRTSPVYENDELYISADDFNDAFGTDITAENDSVVYNGVSYTPEKGIKTGNSGEMLPVIELSKNLLGKYTFDDTAGMVIVSDTEMYFDLSEVTPYHRRPDTTSIWDTREWMSDIQLLNDYILFDRPSKELLLDAFNQSTENGLQHPRLYADQNDFDNIKKMAETDSFLKEGIDSLIEKADTVAAKDPLTFQYDDNFRTLNTANEIESRMFSLGFAYQMTGDTKYIDAAWKNFETFNNFPDLNPAHPIDLGSYMSGMAVGYDWMYHGFTAEQRETICANAKRLGLSVLNEAFYGGIPARTVKAYTQNTLSIPYKWISNYNLWINRGAMASAISFMEYDTELCSDLLSHTIRSAEYGLKGFFPGGAWQESTSYWGIAANFTKNIYALQKIFGTDFNLSKMQGVSETGRFFISICSPLEGNYNYHDSWPEKQWAKAVFNVIGTVFDQPEVIAARKAALAGIFEGRAKDSWEIWDALMYNPEISADEFAKTPKSRFTVGAEIFAVHEDWLNSQGMFFASQGGPIKCYHYHEDAGDFAFELDGVRWACTMGAEDYNSSLTNKEKYRWRAEGHNTVVINNDTEIAQKASAYVPAVSYDAGEGGAYVIYDMTEAYEDADLYKRGFYISDNFRTLTVRDEITLNKSSEIYWFMHTQTSATVLSENSVLLSQGDKSVIVTFDAEGAQTAEISVMDAVPLDSSPQGEGQNPNNGYRKIAIRLTGDSQVNLSVNISEFGGQPSMAMLDSWTAPEASVTEEDTDFGFTLTVDGEEKNTKSYISVYDVDNLPDIQIEPNDSSKTAEVELSDSLEEASEIIVYNADKSKYKMYMIPYKMNYSYPGGEYDSSYTYSEIAGFDASSEQDGNPATNMFDGNFDTRWTTLAEGENVVLDLGSEKAVDAVSAGFWKSDSREYSFELYYSTDGVIFNQIGDTFRSELAPEGQQVFGFDRINARYIKYVGKGNSANVNSNVLEFRVLTRK